MTTPATQTCYVGGEPAATTCTNCGRALCQEHAVKGQPFISARELITTGVRAPSLLLGPPLEEVEYCPTCREELASKRTGEQLKVLLGMILVLVLIGGLIFAIAS